MRREWLCALLPLLAGSFAITQQAASPTPSSAPNPQPTPAVAYYAGPGVTAPELLPFAGAIAPIPNCRQLDGTAVLSAIVDANGITSEIYLLRPIGTDLDFIALKVAAADRFKPGTHDGSPAAVVVSIKIKLASCLEETRNESGQKDYNLNLRSLPVQEIELQKHRFGATTLTLSSNVPQRAGNETPRPYRVGGNITPPVPLINPEAQYTDEAQEKKIRGACIIGLIVDVHGMPQEIHIIRSIEPSLDRNALIAVGKYRFTPAMDGGHPVPVYINVEVNFRI